MDRQPTRAAEIAREHAFSWLPPGMQALLTADRCREYNALIADGLLSFSGPKSLSKPIRNLIPNLSSKEAIQYAVYAFAWAMEEASIEHMERIGIRYKKAIASVGCCTTCQSNKDQGAVPLGEPFRSGHMHAPFCATCRCATTAAREAV